MIDFWNKLRYGRIRAPEPLPIPEGQVELTLSMVYGQSHKRTFKGAPGATPEQVAGRFILDSGRCGIFDMGGNKYILLRDVRDITVKRLSAP